MVNVPTVFVVDDDPSVRTAVERLLVSVGLPCETFSTAPEFLKRAEAGLVGCLVLDVRMPGPSGLDLQRMLASAGHEIPIIFVTAHADVPLTVRAMKEGALEVLTKPFDDQAFLDLVVGTPQIAQRQDEVLRHELAHVLMQHRPAHFERRHEVVIHEKGLRHRRRPMLETKIADRADGIRRFLRCKGPRLNRAPSHQRIGEKRHLSIPREERISVCVADVLDERLQ